MFINLEKLVLMIGKISERFQVIVYRDKFISTVVKQNYRMFIFSRLKHLKSYWDGIKTGFP